MMPNSISLDENNITLKDLLAMADEWDNVDAADLTQDQVAILNLKRVMEIREAAKSAVATGAVGGGAAIGVGGVPGWESVACFICGTGA